MASRMANHQMKKMDAVGLRKGSGSEPVATIMAFVRLLNEAGSMASVTAAGTAFATHGEPMIPV